MNLLHSLFLPFIMIFLIMPFSQPAPAKFRGVIVDPEKARIPKVSVLVENDKNKWNLQANENGEFNCELPAGIYKLTLEPPLGFKKLTVYNFRIDEDTAVAYEFEMEIGDCSDCDWIVEEPAPTPSVMPSGS